MTGVVHEISGFYISFTILGFPGAIVNIFSLYTKTTRKVNGFKKKIVNFQNIMKIEFCWKLIFEILIIHKTSLGSCEVPPHKIWARSVQMF